MTGSTTWPVSGCPVTGEPKKGLHDCVGHSPQLTFWLPSREIQSKSPGRPHKSVELGSLVDFLASFRLFLCPLALNEE